MIPKMLLDVSEYYSNKVAQHGCTPRGVDWNGCESQCIRFAQLLKVCDKAELFSLGDFGCGYGALLDYLNNDARVQSYHGYDLSLPMIQNAIQRNLGNKHASFSSVLKDLEGVDYLVASGVFNVRLDTPDADWLEHMKESLLEMDRHSALGFSFNALTSYSDKEKMRDYLYYADPLFWFDFCKRNFSSQVALLHDYGLYEFTILVRKTRNHP